MDPPPWVIYIPWVALGRWSLSEIGNRINVIFRSSFYVVPLGSSWDPFLHLTPADLFLPSPLGPYSSPLRSQVSNGPLRSQRPSTLRLHTLLPTRLIFPGLSSLWEGLSPSRAMLPRVPSEVSPRGLLGVLLPQLLRVRVFSSSLNRPSPGVRSEDP